MSSVGCLCLFTCRLVVVVGEVDNTKHVLCDERRRTTAANKSTRGNKLKVIPRCSFADARRRFETPSRINGSQIFSPPDVTARVPKLIDSRESNVRRICGKKFAVRSSHIPGQKLSSASFVRERERERGRESGGRFSGRIKVANSRSMTGAASSR